MKTEFTYSELSKELTLTVSVKKDIKFNIRFWIALKIIKLGAVISPFKIEFIQE